MKNILPAHGAAMPSERKCLPNNMAGIEFVACLEDIKELLRQSWKHSQIHRQLKQEGKITMSYGAFCYHMRRLSLDKYRPGEEKPATPPKAAQSLPVRPVAPRRIAASSGSFPDPRDMNLDDAF